MTSERFQRKAQDIGGDLFPQGGAGPSIGHARSGGGEAQFGQHLKMMVEAEGDALQNGPIQVGPAVGEGQAEEQSPAWGSKMGVFFAQEIGEHEQPVGHRAESPPPRGLRSHSRPRASELVAEPADNAPLAAMMPLIRNLPGITW